MEPVAGPVGSQLGLLGAAFPGSTAMARDDGTILIMVPAIMLSAAWNQATTAVWFLAPAGFPLAQPDCFWAEPALRLTSGAMPQSTNLTPVPGTTEPKLWFSWHLSAPWNPVKDNLLTYVRVIQQRLARGN